MNIIKNNQDNKLTVGIDIGSKNIMCAIGSINNDTKTIKLLASSKIESSGMKKGIITNRDELIKRLEVLLNDCEKMANRKVSNAILSITGEHIRCLNTQAAIALNRSNTGNQGNSHGRDIRNEDVLQVLDLAQAVSLSLIHI